MGIGSLRRYHKPLTTEGASPEAPEVAPGITDTEAEARAAAEATEAKLAQEQAEQAEAANSHPNTTADDAEDKDEDADSGDQDDSSDEEQPPAESVNEVIQEAGAEAADDTKHGDLERPNRGSSKAIWAEYGEADPSAVKGWTEGMTRDQLAAHYLGEK